MNKKEIEEQLIKMAKETGKIGINCNDFCGYPHLAAAGWEAPNGTDASTREEQIEEMAIGLEEEFALCGTLSSCGTKRCSRCFSKYLYEQGYRKLPEDSVVLSREEYKKLQEVITDLKYDKFDLKNKISEKDNKIALLEETIDCIKFNVDFARKETAEKILDLLVPNCKACDENWHSGCLCLRATLAEKIAKQFGVEVVE